MDGYNRVEFSMSAVRDEDLDAVRAALGRIRNKYSAGGSSLGIGQTRPDTILNNRSRAEAARIEKGEQAND